MSVPPTARARRDTPGEDGRAGRQGGFALVLALLILVAVTVLAAGGLWVEQADSKTAVNHRMSSRAFQLADAGLSRFVGEESGVPETPRSYDFAEGSAEVISERLGVFAGGHEMYRLEATAELASDPKVTRTVTTRVMLDPLQISLPGSLTSGGDVKKQGDDGLISGLDDASSGDCPEAPQPDRPGVITENYDQSGGTTSCTNADCSCRGPICGDNPDPIVETSDPLSGVDIDWQGILDGNVVEFDQVTPDASTWPSATGDDWPVIFIDNDSQVSLSDASHSGHGMIIVKGDVKLKGEFKWDGVILVGGSLVSSGGTQFSGGFATGLNELIGGSPADTDLGSGQKTFQYNSCDVLRAMKEAGTLFEVPGNWRDVL